MKGYDPALDATQNRKKFVQMIRSRFGEFYSGVNLSVQSPLQIIKSSADDKWSCGPGQSSSPITPI